MSRPGPAPGPPDLIATPDGSGQPDPVPSPPADLRLLGPVVCGWAVSAGLLGQPAPWRAGVAGLGCVLAGVAWWAGAHVVLARRWAQAACAFVPLTGLVVALLVGASAVHGWARSAAGLPELARHGAVVKLTGVVVSDPVRISRIEPATQSWLVRVSVDRFDARGVRRGGGGTVLIRGDERWATVQWHSTVQVTGRLSATDPADPEVAVVKPLGPLQVRSPPGPLERGAESVREGLRQATLGLPADARGLLPALVDGDTSLTPPDLSEAMRTTGMSHLSAVSGSNVAITLAMVLWLCGWLRIRLRWRPWVGVVAVALFVILARPEPSVIRAAVMGSIGLMGVLGARAGRGLPTLAGAIAILLCLDPWLARSFGFVLSSLATLGLLLFVRPWSAAIRARLPAALGFLGEGLAIPTAAHLMCAPVVVLLQGSVSIVGIAANALAAPLVAPATLAGVATAILAPISPALASLPAWVGALPCLGMAWIARTFAGLRWGAIAWPDSGWGALLLTGVFIVFVCTGRYWVHLATRHPMSAAGLAVLVLAAFAPTRPLAWPPPDWRFLACDVGEADALVLRSGPESAVVVDTGADPTLVDGCLASLGIEDIDAVVITHFHADHAGGLAGVVSGRRVRHIYTSPVRDPVTEAANVDRIARAEQIPVTPVWAGDTLAMGEVSARVWGPGRRIDAGSVPNNASIMMSVRTGELTAFMTGDAEREADAQVRRALTVAGVRSFDVLKVAHHGSSNFDPLLLQWIRAPIAIISVGADNDYGHPAPSTLTALTRGGFRVWRTDLHGQIAVVSTSAGPSVATQK